MPTVNLEWTTPAGYIFYEQLFNTIPIVPIAFTIDDCTMKVMISLACKNLSETRPLGLAGNDFIYTLDRSVARGVWGACFLTRDRVCMCMHIQVFLLDTDEDKLHANWRITLWRCLSELGDPRNWVAVKNS